MAPNISQRKFIKPGDGPAHEDTTTIVLTSNKGFYVDIRLALDSSLTPEDRLQWAFAGTTENLTNEDGSRHTTWHHFVDNQSRTPENDSGDMYEQEDGDTLEKGEMADPTGKIIPYQELWTDLEIGGPYAGVGKTDKVCVVLKLEKPKDEALGMIARIGGRIQGVVRVGDKIDYGIWVYDAGEWKKTESFAKSSPLSVASVLFDTAKVPDENEFVEGGRVVAGDHVEAGNRGFLTLDSDRGWQVVEKYFF